MNFRLFSLVEQSFSVFTARIFCQDADGRTASVWLLSFLWEVKILQLYITWKLPFPFKQPGLLVLLCYSLVSLLFLSFPVMATHWANGDQRHFMEMLSFERLEKLFYPRILHSLNGRQQHSKRSEEQPVQPRCTQHSWNISTSSCLTGEWWFKILPVGSFFPFKVPQVHLLRWLWNLPLREESIFTASSQLLWQFSDWIHGLT